MLMVRKSENGNICFVPVLTNNNIQKITIVWVFAETKELISYAVFRLSNNPNSSEWKFLSDFMTYRVFGANNELGIILKPINSSQTRMTTPVVVTTCNAIYTGSGGILEYQYTDCFDHVFWIEEPENLNKYPDPGSGELPGGDGNVRGSGSSSNEFIIGGSGNNEQKKSEEPKNPASTPCGRAERMSLDQALNQAVQNLFNDIQSYRSGDTEKGWIKTNEGKYIFPSIMEEGKAKYNEANIVGLKITEQYHSHPTGSCIPSWSDLEMLAYRYNHGQIDVENFSYGIVSDMGCISLVIINEENFAEFVNGIQNDNFHEAYDAMTRKPNTYGINTAISKFIDFLKEMQSGISIIFNMPIYDTETDSMILENEWYPRDSNGNAEPKDVFCLI